MNCLKASKYLLNLISRSQGLPQKSPLEPLLRLASKNGLLIAIGDALGGADSLPKPYDHCYRQAKQLEANSITIINKLLTQCKSDGLPLLTIKSFLPFPYADNNIDVVAVEAKVVEQYRELLHCLGFVRHRNLADIREPKKEMYIHSGDRDSNCVYPKMHLHRTISWNGVVYLDPMKIWSRHGHRNTRGAVVPIPSAEDELLIMAAHVMFENKYITLCDLAYFEWLIGRDFDWDYVVEVASDRNWQAALGEFLSTAYALGNLLGIPLKVGQEFSRPMKFSFICFPLIVPLPRTLRTALAKLWQDVMAGRLNELPRQLFTYFPVDCLWMYSKARRKIRSF
jgi:hypothetical protein